MYKASTLPNCGVEPWPLCHCVARPRPKGTAERLFEPYSPGLTSEHQYILTISSPFLLIFLFRYVYYFCGVIAKRTEITNRSMYTVCSPKHAISNKSERGL